MIKSLICFSTIITIVSSASKWYDGPIRPYEFGYKIENHQHRYEKKDSNGVIMGEFGFITADGVYHLTVYATDENGNFKIVSMKNIKLEGLNPAPDDQFNTRQQKSNDIEKSQPAATTQKPVRSDVQSPLIQSPPVTSAPNNNDVAKFGCSNCIIPELEVTKVTPKLDVTSPRTFANKKFQTSTTSTPTSSNLGTRNDDFMQNGIEEGQQEQIEDPNSVKSTKDGTNIRGRGNLGPSVVNTGSNRPTQISKTNQVSDKPGQTRGDTGKGIEPTGRSLVPSKDEVSTAPVQPSTNENELPSKKEQTAKVGREPTQSAVVKNQIPDTTESSRDAPEGPSVQKSDSKMPTRKFGMDKTEPSKPSTSGRGASGRADKSFFESLPVPAQMKKMFGDLLYKFNYTAGFHGHNEQGDREGAKEGSYFNVGRDGYKRVVDYSANEFGYQPVIALKQAQPDEIPDPATEKENKRHDYEFKWFFKNE